MTVSQHNVLLFRALLSEKGQRSESNPTLAADETSTPTLAKNPAKASTCSVDAKVSTVEINCGYETASSSNGLPCPS